MYKLHESDQRESSSHDIQGGERDYFENKQMKGLAPAMPTRAKL